MDLSQFKYIVYFWRETPFNMAISEFIKNLLDKIAYNQEIEETLVRIPVLAKKTSDETENYFQDPNKVLNFIKEMSEMFWKNEILFIYIFWLQKVAKNWINREDFKQYNIISFDEFIKNNT